MILYTNGCSFTYGEELVDPTSSCWPTLLSKKLHIKLINEAITGKSNTWIFRQTVNYIFNNLDKLNSMFIILGWTMCTRIEYYINDIHHIVVYNNMDLTPYGHDVLKPIFESFFQDDVSIQKYYVVCMKNILNYYKIPYIFFNIRNDEVPGKERFINIKTDIGYDIEDQKYLFNKKEYMNISMYDYCINTHCKIGKKFHPLEDGHKAWADYLYNHMEKNFNEELIRLR